LEKVIIILTGVNEGKNKFIDTIKENGWWTWNVNSSNRLSSLSYELGWNGEHNKNYFDFIQKFKQLANTYFDFENKYIDNLINKFMGNEKANALIVHNIDPEKSKSLQDAYQNCYSIHITDGEMQNAEYCKMLNFKDENYVNNVLEVMDVLTKDFTELAQEGKVA
jgi:hypothetical protein